MSEPAAPAYTVNYLPRATAQAVRMLQLATIAGRGAAMVAEVEAMERRLRVDPHEFGDPLYTLHAVGWRVCERALPNLFVNYAIDDARRVVTVGRFLAPPGWSFGLRGVGG